MERISTNGQQHDGNRTIKDTTLFKVKSQFNSFKIISVDVTDQQGRPSNLEKGELGFIKVNLESSKSIATLVTVNIFDSELTSIGIGSVQTTLSSGNSEIVLSFLIPSDIASGPAEIFVNAFSDWPSNGGIPLTSEFSIIELIGTSNPHPTPSPTPEPSEISVQTDDNHYDEGDVIVVSGNVSIVLGETPITFQLFFEGSLVDIAQITVAQDGSYSHTIIAEGPLWKKIGNYLIRISYGEGNIAETEFSFSPKLESVETTTIFEVNLGSFGTFDVEYTIKGGTIKNMIVDTNIFALIVQIESTDEGSISLDLPRKLIGAEKQDGIDDTFIILIDGIEVAYQESVVHSDSRVVTINFEEGDSDIKIMGTYVVGN